MKLNNKEYYFAMKKTIQLLFPILLSITSLTGCNEKIEGMRPVDDDFLAMIGNGGECGIGSERTCIDSLYARYKKDSDAFYETIKQGEDIVLEECNYYTGLYVKNFVYKEMEKIIEMYHGLISSLYAPQLPDIPIESNVWLIGKCYYASIGLSKKALKSKPMLLDIDKEDGIIKKKIGDYRLIEFFEPYKTNKKEDILFYDFVSATEEDTCFRISPKNDDTIKRFYKEYGWNPKDFVSHFSRLSCFLLAELNFSSLRIRKNDTFGEYIKERFSYVNSTIENYPQYYDEIDECMIEKEDIEETMGEIRTMVTFDYSKIKTLFKIQ